MDETGSYGWRRALIFASDHRGAPQKSAKRKRFQCVPYSFRVSEGSAEPFRSGSLAASVPAARYDANCCKISFPAGQFVPRVNSLSIYTNRKYPCHTKSSLLLRGGDFFLPFYSSLFAVHSTGTPHQFFRKKGFSLYKREDFPWLGWGFCLWLRQGSFPAHWARRFHREQAHRLYFMTRIPSQIGSSGR